MNSIRTTFILSGIAGVIVILVIASIATYWAVERGLEAQLDDALIQELGVFAAVVEFGEDGLLFDVEDFDMGDFEIEEDEREGEEDEGEFSEALLEVRTVDGETLYRSPGEMPAGWDELAADETPTLVWLERDGERIRAVSLRCLPRVDDPEELDEAVLAVVEQGGLEPVVLRLGRPDRFRRPFLARFGVLAGIVPLLAVVLTGLLMFAIGGRALRGLDDLADEIARLPVDGTAVAIQEARVPKEARPIVARLNALVDRVHEVVARERELSIDIAHELRTPVAGLRSMIEVSLHRERPSPEYRDTLEGALSVVVQVERMVGRLLQLHRMELGQLEPESEALDLGTCVRDQWSVFEAEALEKNVRVEFDVDGAPALVSDPTLLPMVLGCLMDNAVSHVDAEGSIRIGVVASNGTARIAIVNSGSQVNQDDVPRLFERFSRGDRARSSTERHMGLGLTIARRAAEAIGAQLQIECERGGNFSAAVTIRS